MSEDSDQEVVLPTVLSNLTNVIDSDSHNFASGSTDIQSAALNATKFLFDLGEHALAKRVAVSLVVDLGYLVLSWFNFPFSPVALVSETTSRPHISDLLSSLNPEEAPVTRSQTKALNGKRKRSPPKIAAFDQTPLTSLFIENAGPEQVWAQLELRAKGVCEMLSKALDGTLMVDEDVDMRLLNGVGGDEDEDEDEGGSARKKLRFEDLSQEDIKSLGVEPDVLKRLIEGMEVDEEGEEELDDKESEDEDDDGEEFGEEVTTLKDPEALDSPGPSRSSRLSRRFKSSAGSQLDDGFFDLASFNAETEETEAKHVSRGRLKSLNEDEDSESDEESIDYFAAIDGDPELDGGVDQTEPMYGDFFDPPPGMASKKSPVRAKAGKVRFHEEVKVKKIKAKGKGLPVNTPIFWEEAMDDDEGFEGFGDEDGILNGHVDPNPDYEEDSEGDDDEDDDMDEDEDEDDGDSEEDDREVDQKGRQAVERLKDDLFADEGSEEESEGGLTNHQKRAVALKEQIAALEAENVAPKKWTLAGEVSARNRPQNSLLEEDLDFERVMKPVPVVTEGAVQELEEMIKSRILANNYDDVVRRRPVDEKPFLPSKLIHLEDTRSAQSLAEVYEDEYSAALNGGIAGEDRNGKLRKEHEEVGKQWEKICAKLDALCNAHFTPKQASCLINYVLNDKFLQAFTITAESDYTSLESALPTSQTASTMLAPEEVLAPSSRAPRSRSEMTPAEKRAQRNKERKKQRRTREQLNKGVDAHSRVKGVKRQKEDALKSLVKTGKGVTVIGKKDKGLVSKRPKGNQGS
ncbi:Mpp10 protein [Thelephora ganbajun]|uniref:Mpp10 protein n=1 Tax=Thelephora ganbajun TaxID=370292 RepID=A0ACB6Z2U7_THEGA|nr:Mpp10 protein [Thelephora ganbajun]